MWRNEWAGFTAAVVPLAIGVSALLIAPSLASAIQAFQESAGQVVIETEHPDANIARGGRSWTLETTTTGFSGTGYMNALPNSGATIDTGYVTSSPELSFNVQFSTTGTYYVWLRGQGAVDDTAHAGLDGTGPASADKLSGFTSSWKWKSTTLDSGRPTITVTSPGVHTIHVWMREDGFKVDKLLLRTSSSTTAPSGTGPAESSRVTVGDTTAPTAPGQPTEGSSTDVDYDADGTYTIYWTAASDPESGVSAYEVSERVGSEGAWTSLTTTTTATSYAVSGRTQGMTYFYRVRAKNGQGVWGAWSPASDGILVDKTDPSAVTVTDDGTTTTSTTQLHATWTASSDPESGIVGYKYIIRQDSTTGATIVGFTSVGLATLFTRTGLSLVNGKTYYIGVRATNGAGRTLTAYSNGITVTTGDTTPPTGTISMNSGAPATKNPVVTLTLSATDNSGTVAQMRFSNDGVTYAPPEPYATTKAWTLTAGDGTKTVYVQFADAVPNWSAAASDSIVLDTTPPAMTITSPINGAIITSP